jgi:hypothetical protein
MQQPGISGAAACSTSLLCAGPCFCISWGSPCGPVSVSLQLTGRRMQLTVAVGPWASSCSMRFSPRALTPNPVVLPSRMRQFWPLCGVCSCVLPVVCLACTCATKCIPVVLCLVYESLVGVCGGCSLSVWFVGMNSMTFVQINRQAGEPVVT